MNEGTKEQSNKQRSRWRKPLWTKKNYTLMHTGRQTRTNRLRGVFPGLVKYTKKSPQTGRTPLLSLLIFVCAYVHQPDKSRKNSELRPVSRKSWKLFSSVMPFLVNLYLKTGMCICLNLLVQKGTSVYIKNSWIKQISNHKIWDFASAFRCENFSGPSRNGSLHC